MEGSEIRLEIDNSLKKLFGDSDLVSETTGVGYHSELRGVERLRTATRSDYGWAY